MGNMIGVGGCIFRVVLGTEELMYLARLFVSGPHCENPFTLVLWVLFCVVMFLVGLHLSVEWAWGTWWRSGGGSLLGGKWDMKNGKAMDGLKGAVQERENPSTISSPWSPGETSVSLCTLHGCKSGAQTPNRSRYPQYRAGCGWQKRS